MKGAIWAFLGLTLLQAALSGRTNTGRIGELGQSISDVLSYVIDPDKPAIPDLSGAASSTTSSSASTTPGTVRAAAPVPAQKVSPNSSSHYV